MPRVRSPAGTSRRPPLIRAARIAGALAAAWLVLTIGVRVAYADRILPGTTMAGLSLGGLSDAAAERVLTDALASRRPVTLTAAGRRFVVDPAVVGYRIDIDASVASAHDAGRGGVVAGIGSTIPALIAPRRLEPVAPIDDALLDAQIASIAAGIDRPARAGDVLVDRDAPGGIRVVAPRARRTLQRDAARDALLRALRDRPKRPVDLPVLRRGGATPDAVRTVARQARDYLRTPLQLEAGKRTLTLTTAQAAGILALQRARGERPGALVLGVDAPAVARLVDELAADLDRTPASARIDAPGRPGVTIDGQDDVSWRPRAARGLDVTPAVAGRELRRAGAAAELTAAVRARSHRVALAFKRLPARLTTGVARTVSSLLGTFTTRYPCCQPRVTNIRLIAEAIDGTVVMPGEPFSLNQTSGERTREGGYVKAPFIADGELAESIGGGVSQVSTTLYNAAFFAGLRIDAHRPHSFYIDRYPAGREATLNYPDIDLRWTNDTPAPVLVRAVTDSTSVVVSLYGGDTGRRVRAQTGPRMPLENKDFAITVTRVLRFRDGKVARQAFTTRYDRPPPPE